MRLDRYGDPDGPGRYSIIDNRTGRRTDIRDPVDDFFVIKLKDQNSRAALLAYAEAAEASDPELAADVRKLAEAAGPNHPHCKRPD